MEETSNFQQNNQYSLSIRFSSDGFSLWVDDISGFLISSKTIARPFISLSKNDIVKIIEHEADALLNYQNIRLIYESDFYTFVPSTLFELGNEIDFMFASNKIDKKDCIISNQISNWETVSIFSLPINLRDAINQLFDNVNIEHHLGYFLTEKIKLRNESGVNIWVRSKIMDVVVIINGNLHLINSFNYNSTEDFTYFTLNIFDQLSLDTNFCKLKLFNTEGNNEIQNIIQKYIKVVEIVS